MRKQITFPKTPSTTSQRDKAIAKAVYTGIKNCCAEFFAPALCYCFSFATELSPKVLITQGFTEFALVFNGLYFNVSRWIFVSCWAHSNCLLIDVDLRTLICVQHTMFTPQSAFWKLLIPWTQNIKIRRHCNSMCQELVLMNSWLLTLFDLRSMFLEHKAGHWWSRRMHLSANRLQMAEKIHICPSI